MFDNFFSLAANLVESRLLHFSTGRFGGFGRKPLIAFFDRAFCRIQSKGAFYLFQQFALPNLVESRFLQIPTIFNLSLRGTKCRGNPPEKVWSIYSVDLHPPGRLLRYCYSALNACALKLSFSAFLSKMQVPYEYRRSQTLASKFAHSALTQRQ